MTLETKSDNDERDRVAPRTGLLSPADVAAYLAVPLRTVYAWRSRGVGPRGYRVGRHVRYMLDDVNAWLEDHRDAS
ncbi:MAG: helix-turn-helix transcriptional regulator [Acidimicrobiia bacterium]